MESISSKFDLESLELAKQIETIINNLSKSVIGTSNIETRNCNIITKPDGHIDVIAGKRIGKYSIVKELGSGTSGTVVETSYNNKSYAIKVIINIPKYITLAYEEIIILRQLSHKHIIKLIKTFKCNTGQIVMVFPKYNYDLNEFMVEEEYQFNLAEIKIIVRQIASAITYMHELGFIHTDLKPENIMLVDNSLNERGRLNEIIVKLIDLGSTHRKIDPHNKLITTAPYRSPEVILGLPWSYPVDIWSFAIIIIQLYTNSQIFEYELPIIRLAMMERIFGPIPYKGFADQTESSRYFFKSGKLRFPELGRSRRAIEDVEDSIPLEEMDIHPLLLDILKRMLRYKPGERITAGQILKHSFITL